MRMPEAFNHACAQPGGALTKILLFNDIQHGMGGYTADRAAAKSSAETAGVWRLHDFRFTDHTGKRVAAGQSFGDGNQVRVYGVKLIRQVPCNDFYA